jgi:hypothetical protein
MYAPHSEQFMKRNETFWYRGCEKRCWWYDPHDVSGSRWNNGFFGLHKYMIQIKEETKEMNISNLFIHDK